MFFPVKRIEDPIGLLPAKLILGINKRGVHFFRWARGVILPVNNLIAGSEYSFNTEWYL